MLFRSQHVDFAAQFFTVMRALDYKASNAEGSEQLFQFETKRFLYCMEADNCMLCKISESLITERRQMEWTKRGDAKASKKPQLRELAIVNAYNARKRIPKVNPKLILE